MHAVSGAIPCHQHFSEEYETGSYKDAFHMFKVLIAREYDRHKVILKSGKISDSERDLFTVS